MAEKHTRKEAARDIIAMRPGFYRNGTLLKVRKSGKDAFFVAAGEDMIELTGESSAIFHANQSAGLEITKDTVAEYLKYFCRFLLGPHGTFYIANEPEVLEVLSDGFILGAPVRYAGYMYKAIFKVRPGGETEMLDDEPLGPVN